MKHVFSLTMHLASEGDALVLRWGREGEERAAVVDFGRTSDYKRARNDLQAIERIELLVVSHIDADHIEGAVPLVREKAAPFAPSDVWYNAYHHLTKAQARLGAQLTEEKLSARQAEKLSVGIQRFHWPWNAVFKTDGVVSVDSPEARAPISLPGDLNITLLSPSDTALSKLEPDWLNELERASLRPFDPDKAPYDAESDRESLSAGLSVEALAASPFMEDSARPNGSSIAFLAEFRGKSVLLSADAHPGALERALRKLGYDENNKLVLNLLKVSHHGSKANTSPALIKIIDCQRFAFSTDGSRHDHPDPETIARLLLADREREKILYFNKWQPNSERWNDEATMKAYRYSCVFAGAAENGLTIDV